MIEHILNRIFASKFKAFCSLVFVLLVAVVVLTIAGLNSDMMLAISGGLIGCAFTAAHSKHIEKRKNAKQVEQS